MTRPAPAAARSPSLSSSSSCSLTPLGAALLVLCHAAPAAAQSAPPVAQLPPVAVISVSPLPGLNLPKDQVPANVQTATGADLDRRHALDLADHLNRTLGSVNINALQGNPFQPDVNYRGFTASPLLGTPQGLSVYLDGMRLNQPFGDVVSWDLIPRAAIASIALMPGSNPLFGLNTLGGALAVQTKNGLTNPGTSVQLSAGSHRRAAVEFETGGGRADGVNWYVTGHRLRERGWRNASPSDVRQLFGKFGLRAGDAELSLTTAVAHNDLSGNGLQERGALARDRTSVYTVPDETRNRSVFVNLAASVPLGDALVFTGNAYYRRITTSTRNGDVNDEALTGSVWQPGADERAALAGAGYVEGAGGYPASGATAANTPFPKWRCIANVLRGDEPNETCNGLVNRTSTRQQNFGVGAQLASGITLAGMEHRWLVGAGLDANRVRFMQGSQFGYIEPDRSITPVDGPGAFADGTQASEDAFDARVQLASRSRTASVYASDTIALGRGTHLTIAGRYNRHSIDNVDAITPGGGPGSLDGHHTYARFNPAIGLTFVPAQAPAKALTVYAGVNQGSRAPSAIELGCADPASPCKLPNSFAGDPPLKQVVTTTLEAGARGTAAAGALAWSVGVFRSDNRDDLLFVADGTSGFGYFRNFGKTRRQGLELGLGGKALASLTLGANLTLLGATYRSAEVVGGSANSSNDAAQAGFPGTEGRIEVRPGDRIPLLARRLLKLYADWNVGAPWSLGADLLASSGANARGNENGLHQPDGTHYTGPGRSAGYAVLNLSADYRPTQRLTVFVKVDNVLDRRYATGAQLGADAFDGAGRYAARPLPRDVNGDYPVRSGTFLAPGAPRAFRVGLKYALAG